MPRPKKMPSPLERQKRVTLQDIANVAGVKKMVVSNALNGTRSVAPATRARVQQIAKELNYIPNFAARALSTGQTGIIALLSGALSEPYYANMVHLLNRHVTDHGFHVMLMRTPGEVRDLVNATGNVAVDGAIAIDMQGLVNEFKSHPSVPCVSIGTVAQSFVDSVVVDLSAGVEAALGLMLAAGRRRIAYLVTAPNMERDTEVRARTYRAVLQRASRALEIISVATDDHETAESRFKNYVETHGCPDALLCQNDQMAMCAYRVLRSLGYVIPRDILLAGCDGHPHMRDFDPPLSTIAQPMEALCALAWQFLQQRIAQPDLPHQSAMLEGKLIATISLLAES